MRDNNFLKDVHPVKSRKARISPAAKLFNGVKVVGFDFDDTLVNEQYSMKKRWERVLKEYSSVFPKIEDTFFKIYRQKGPSYGFHLDDTLGALKINITHKDKILSRLMETHGDELVFDGADYLLELLKNKGLKIGIITNGTQSRQEVRIKKTGIYKFMDFILYGRGVKERKLNAENLEDIKKHFKRFNVDSFGEFLYVGNDFALDIEGMLSMGAKACWVTNKKSNFNNDKLIVVKNLKELSKYL